MHGRLLWSYHDRIVNGNNLIILQFFGMICGMAVLIVGAEEFEPLVIFPGNYSDLRTTLAAIFHQAMTGMS